MTKALKILITGGGTGGHVFPAIAIADALKSLNEKTEIRFVGAKGKMEMERVPKAGYEIEGLWISGFQRKMSFQNLLFPLKLMKSLWDARRIVWRFQPDVVVGVGGYASGPVMRAAVGRGVPTLIQEQNGFAGVTNRLLASQVSRVCVAYDGMAAFFPKEKIVFTGNPVRQDILDLKGKKNGSAGAFWPRRFQKNDFDTRRKSRSKEFEQCDARKFCFFENTNRAASLLAMRKTVRNGIPKLRNGKIAKLQNGRFR